MSAVAANEAIRLKRLVFYADDVTKFNQVLSDFVRKAGATSVALIDVEGHLVARQGLRGQGDPATLAALVAGAFASTRQVARLLGEADFTTLSHGGKDTAIHITLIGARTLQVAVFPSSVKPGMISVFAKELAVQIQAVLAQAESRSASEPAPSIEQGYSQAMKSQLDDLFGNL